jgi:capsular polysaccharide biosynthesis protein
MRTSVFHVLDPPAVQPVTLTAKSPVVKALLGGFGGVALLEAMLIYVLAKRDPRVRSGEEVEERLGLRNLGSTPLLDRF